MVIVGIYRPPRALCGEYQSLLESELSYVCNWASLNINFVVVTGDLNLNRLRPDKPEGKLLLDLEVEQGFECLITKPTRIEKRGIKSLIDVLLANRPDSFKLSGNYHLCLSDHDLVYGVLKQKINHNKPKVITFRSCKNFDPEHYKQLLSSAPWHIGGTAIERKSIEDFRDHPCVQRVQYENRNSTQTIEIELVTQGQVLAALDSLNINTATGTDGIPSKALKIGANELSAPPTTLFNSCINKNALPSKWKCGHWAPVYKKDDMNAKENYRPITLLPRVSKVLEKLVGVQINSGFGNRIYQNSSAYRKAHSCETTLINLVEDWRLARDQRQVVSILSTDMSKAFDSLHPPLLLNKLEAYGFQESAIQLLNSYLNERRYQVKIGRHVSSSRCVSRGCPQGSALGPLLWNISVPE